MDFFSERLPVAERAAGYEAALRSYFSEAETDVRVQVTPACPEAFIASLESVTIGRLFGAVHRTNSPHVLHSEPVLSSRADLDFYFVSAGEISFTLDSGPVRLSAGDLFLLPARAEFLARCDSIDMLAVGVPEELLAGVAQGDSSSGYRIAGDSGFASCLGALLRSVSGRHRELLPPEANVLQLAIVDAIRLWATREPGVGATVLSAQQQHRLSEVKALALRSLHNPSLDPDSLAHEAGISPRTLHRLFHASGTTFRSWLRDCRLQRCWMELTDPGRHRNTVALVAFGWGFNDLRTFNRAFKERYGITPGEARESGRGYRVLRLGNADHERPHRRSGDRR